MAPLAGQRFTSPQGNQGVPHSVQSPRQLPINQVRLQVVPHSPLLQTTLQVLVGHWALDVELIASNEASLLPAANDQALWLSGQPSFHLFLSHRKW